MRTTVGVLFCLYGCIWIACQNDKSGEVVQEIRTGASNADIVRNPVNADGSLDTMRMARITFEETEFDFGEVQEGDMVEHVFSFTNTGKAPLLIDNARSSCGCTVPEWTTEPIEPGGKGVITAKFNTEGRSGEQKKLIYIASNAHPGQTSVSINGMVKPKE
jgi:hypothetical protein